MKAAARCFLSAIIDIPTVREWALGGGVVIYWKLCRFVVDCLQIGWKLIGDELNPQKEQDRDECEAEGIQENPNFVLSDPGNLTENCESESTGLFKKVTLLTDDELEKLTEKLDDDQRLVLSQVQNYSRDWKYQDWPQKK